ncbi:1586_t:CDS:2 [Scutellospora calospora]|uniref:1586_t:CDS:1 n=1 Tax=Scutellospora calospora TaxID=85575 RepID=A0ACA9K6H4_9GLOM|nr:1586_t:CDS:2 [Scutellospora calospora]
MFSSQQTENIFWWDIQYTLNETTLTSLIFTWDRKCRYCLTMLLTGELLDFCCNHGKRIIPRLLPYPTSINNITKNSNISTLSRKLNALFSFIAIGAQGQFVNLPVLSSRFQNESSSNAILKLLENTSIGEVATIIYANNAVNIYPRSITIWRREDTMPKFINILSTQYEPLQYPLLFLHATQETTNIIFEDYEDEATENEEGNLHLPAFFLGSKRWCSLRVANALALARCWGKPSFFITMTTNPNWEEIKSQLRPSQNALEIAPIIVCAFHSRFEKLKELLKTYFGQIIYIVDVIEFQKYGFLHAHVVVRVHPELSINQIDKIISVELLNNNSQLKELVEKYMIYKSQHSSQCLRNNKCIYGYPKPIILETYIDEKGPDYVKYNINIVTTKNSNSQDYETTNNANSTLNENNLSTKQQFINNFKDYINRRYLSAPKAA